MRLNHVRVAPVPTGPAGAWLPAAHACHQRQAAAAAPPPARIRPPLSGPRRARLPPGRPAAGGNPAPGSRRKPGCARGAGARGDSTAAAGARPWRLALQGSGPEAQRTGGAGDKKSGTVLGPSSKERVQARAAGITGFGAVGRNVKEKLVAMAGSRTVRVLHDLSHTNRLLWRSPGKQENRGRILF